ncbi:MAG TPA: CDP-alcohol phosphatidyltransferase family protein [Acidimicrobiales bacterium]|nr:CDP-alcohol phosphatidyltransferase family protein [Acidimicrobiales bacterium]
MLDGRRGRKDGQAEPAEGTVEDDAGAPDLSASLTAIGIAAPAASEAEPPLTAQPVGGQTAEPAGEAKRSNAFVRLLKALGPGLVKVGVTADHVTLFGIVVSLAAGFLIGTGYLIPAIGLLTFGGLMDTLDGAVAKAAGTSSKRGAFFDSVSDRVADMFIFGGLSWYFAVGPGHDPRMALLPLAILGVANTISYERAKAESLGYDAKGGIMERAERLIVVGVALLWHVTLAPVLGVLLVLCVVTALQRFFKVWRQATENAPLSEPEPALAFAGGRTKRPARVESRWRAWREAKQTPERRRQRVSVTARARSRRHPEPLTTRVRRAFGSETSSRNGARSWSSAVSRAGTSSRTGRTARSERRQQGSAAAFRRRLGSGR